MKLLLLIFSTIFLCFCSSQSNLHTVWPVKESGITYKKYGPAISEVKSPRGFTITPEDVSEMCSPRKYQIVIYADDVNYYVAKITASPTDAKKYGESIHGRTGQITHPEKKNKHSIIHISPYKKISDN